MGLNGSQRPVQMHVISDSILTDREPGLTFVATLWYHMHFRVLHLSLSLSFNLILAHHEHTTGLCACVSIFLSLSL